MPLCISAILMYIHTFYDERHQHGRFANFVGGRNTRANEPYVRSLNGDGSVKIVQLFYYSIFFENVKSQHGVMRTFLKPDCFQSTNQCNHLMTIYGDM